MFSASVFAVEADKQKHFGYSAAISAAIDQVLYHSTDMSYPERIGASIAATIAIGLAKELSDEHFDHQDLLFDIAGTLAGVTLSEAVNIYVRPIHGGAVATANFKF